MSYRIALLVAAGTMALGTASAQDAKEGFYATAGASYAFDAGENDFQSETRSGGFDAQEFDTELDLSNGFGAYGALGKYFSRGFRAEVELSWRIQDVEELPGDGAAFAGFPTGANGQNIGGGASLGDNRDLGEVAVGALMLNGYKDFNLDVAGRFQPYIGAGIGIARVRADFDNVDDQPVVFDSDDLEDLPIGFQISTRNDDYVPAVQGLAGFNIGMTDSLSLNVGYRYLRTAEYDFESFVNAEVVDVEGRYNVHEATVGLRWDFGASAAPVQTVAPQPQPQTKTCLDGTVVPMNQPCPDVDEGLTPADLATVVYFEFDRSDLSPAARQLLQRRAGEASDLDIIEVLVSGNTDTSGSASYNEQLSARRARVVRDALVSYGIDASKIQIRALGETNLAKPTQDGVKEPLNRRTEVEFDF
ncbi:OmpA family protein [Parvularcula maris]|uniref:OmpA family protein n=1 Tax=Parvularcula maris TaxID=2965077 RepID=A0A9X2RGW4_9PROT|nr:OmpA family protein [Parvularcula maris]MCQ8184259.1 OmpA family protein [Parvularcula maris]